MAGQMSFIPEGEKVVINAISLWQPWATLVALGKKRFETRTWMMTYRGPLAIHATKVFPRASIRLCGTEPFKSVLAEAGYQRPAQLPMGVIVAVARLTAVESTAIIQQRKDVDPLEIAFGDYGPGRFAWQLDEVLALPQPVEARGKQRLWPWAVPPHVMDFIVSRRGSSWIKR